MRSYRRSEIIGFAKALLLCVILIVAPAVSLPVWAAPPIAVPPGPTNAALSEAAQIDHQAPIPPRYMRQEVAFETDEPPGTIAIDTASHFLYLVLPGDRAVRYRIGWAREGFEWAGTERVTRKAEWPSWSPPAEMLLRQPELPAYMPGGPNNPLGARALYLGSTLYRIHGTSEPWTIGQNDSSGCIRLLNEDVIDLYERVKKGAKVVVF